MTRRGFLAGFFLLLALGAGWMAGYTARHHRGKLPAPRSRPPALEEALAAWEGGSPSGLAAALERLDGEALSDEEDRAEVDLLRALASGEEARLLEVARAHPATQGGARALWAWVGRAPGASDRQARTEAFGRAFPRAWVLGPAPDRERP